MVSLDAARANAARFLKYLEDEGIKFEKFSHPVVLTVEEQAKHVGQVAGALAKNLLLKDKKGRLILVTALTSTPVDLKLLSQRLGLGKGGLRMAPLENLGTVLQVPEGSVTPLAVFNDSARALPLLLDKGFQNQERLLVHPLVNDATIAMDRDAFERFLRGVGREANYVDLEAVVAVGKDQPPDLAHLLQGTGTAVEAAPEGESSNSGNSGGSTSTVANPPAQQGSGPPAAKAASSSASSKAAKADGKSPPKGPPGDDVAACTESILALLRSLPPLRPGSDSQGECAKAEMFIREELEHILVMFKNAAYTQGFVSAKASANMSSR